MSEATPDFLEGEALEDGIGLCLSGGGFRATLYHLGAIVRLNECGLLPRLDRVSSVSGGSIAAGALGICWNKLTFDKNGVATNLGTVFCDPLLVLCGWRLDLPVILLGLLPFVSAANLATRVYDHVLFHGATLQDLPERPRFVFTATSLQTGQLWRFARPYAADWRVGEWRNPDLGLAWAVGASAAFPPFMSPARLRLRAGSVTALPGADLSRAPFTGDLVLTDGGIYDNLGLEPVWKRFRTILVSDAGLANHAVPAPWSDWLNVSRVAMGIALQQGIDMRLRVLRGLHASGQRTVCHWGIGRHIIRNGSSFREDQTARAAAVPTRLTAYPIAVRSLVIRAGYLHTDGALVNASMMPEHVGAPDPGRLPYATSFA